MVKEVWQDFFTDHQFNRILEGSEVWQNYSKAELARDVVRQKTALEATIDDENKIMDDVELFSQKVAGNPVLKAKFKQVKLVLEANPELREKADPTFLNGLSLIDFED